MAVLDAGADEVREEDDVFIIESEPNDVVVVRTALRGSRDRLQLC